MFSTSNQLGKRLGGKYNNPKELHKRVLPMCERFNLTSVREVVGKTKQYRVWTSKNFSLCKAALQNCDALDDHDNCSDLWPSFQSKESDSLSPQGDSFVNNKCLFEEDCHDKPVVHHLLSKHQACVGISQLVEQGTSIEIPVSSYFFSKNCAHCLFGNCPATVACGNCAA